MSLRAIFLNKRILFRYTDNHPELCNRKKMCYEDQIYYGPVASGFM